MSSPEKAPVKKSSIFVAFRFRGMEDETNPDEPLMGDIIFSDSNSLAFETQDFTFDHLFLPTDT